MPRYKITKIPAGCTYNIWHGVQPETEQWKARRLPEQWAVLDMQWRVFNSITEKWIYPKFPWVIVGNFNSCREWMDEHKYDDDVQE